MILQPGLLGIFGECIGYYILFLYKKHNVKTEIL